jgi:hypothetical protein
VGAGTAPGPIERVRNESRLDRVAGQVPAGGDQLLIAGDLAGARMRAEEVRAAPVTAVLGTGILRVQTLQRLGQAPVGYAQERVVVASHQDVGEERELEPLAGRGQARKEVFAVLAP